MRSGMLAAVAAALIGGVAPSHSRGGYASARRDDGSRALRAGRRGRNRKAPAHIIDARMAKAQAKRERRAARAKQ